MRDRGIFEDQPAPPPPERQPNRKIVAAAILILSISLLLPGSTPTSEIRPTSPTPTPTPTEIPTPKPKLTGTTDGLQILDQVCKQEKTTAQRVIILRPEQKQTTSKLHLPGVDFSYSPSGVANTTIDPEIELTYGPNGTSQIVGRQDNLRFAYAPASDYTLSRDVNAIIIAKDCQPSNFPIKGRFKRENRELATQHRRMSMRLNERS